MDGGPFERESRATPTWRVAMSLLHAPAFRCGAAPVADAMSAGSRKSDVRDAKARALGLESDEDGGGLVSRRACGGVCFDLKAAFSLKDIET